MPDQNGQLTEEETQKFLDWINEKSVDHTCPVCKKNSWSAGSHLLNGMVHTGGALVVGGPAYPAAFIVCKNCAYTRQFMAVPIGLMKTEDESEEKQDVS